MLKPYQNDDSYLIAIVTNRLDVERRFEYWNIMLKTVRFAFGFDRSVKDHRHTSVGTIAVLKNGTFPDNDLLIILVSFDRDRRQSWDFIAFGYFLIRRLKNRTESQKKNSVRDTENN